MVRGQEKKRKLGKPQPGPAAGKRAKRKQQSTASRQRRHQDLYEADFSDPDEEKHNNRYDVRSLGLEMGICLLALPVLGNCTPPGSNHHPRPAFAHPLRKWRTMSMRCPLTLRTRR